MPTQKPTPSAPESDTPTRIAVAAVVHAEHGAADGLLADFAASLRQQGWRVRGLVQQPVHDDGEDTAMLVDLDGGQRFRLFQNLGPGSASCRIDPGGVAAASIALRRALQQPADLVIVNRFGALEASGGGFVDEMAALVSENIPFMTVVATPYLLNWQRFTGRLGTELPPEPAALAAWFAQLEHPTVCA